MFCLCELFFLVTFLSCFFTFGLCQLETSISPKRFILKLLSLVLFTFSIYLRNVYLCFTKFSFLYVWAAKHIFQIPLNSLFILLVECMKRVICLLTTVKKQNSLVFARYLRRTSRVSAILAVLCRRARRGRNKGARCSKNLALHPWNMLSRLVFVSGMD